jgi:hypothetical protein
MPKHPGRESTESMIVEKGSWLDTSQVCGRQTLLAHGEKRRNRGSSHQSAALQMDQPALQSGHNRLGTVLDVQSHENRADVAFYGSLCNAQHVGNVFVAVPSH